jgi:hypothetical protein
MERCRTDLPPEVTFADGVRVACHLYPSGSDGIPIPVPSVTVSRRPGGA